MTPAAFAVDEFSQRIEAIVGTVDESATQTLAGSPKEQIARLRRMKAELSALRKELTNTIREVRAHHAAAPEHHHEPSAVCLYVEGVLGRGIAHSSRSSGRGRQLQILLAPYQEVKRRIDAAISDLGRRTRAAVAAKALGHPEVS